MVEERVTTVEPRDGSPAATHHTTIIRDEDSRRSSGSGWLIAIVLVIAVIAGIYLFTQMSATEAVKDNAIAGAANEVGEAAGQVGNAAGQVGDAARDAAENLAP